LTKGANISRSFVSSTISLLTLYTCHFIHFIHLPLLLSNARRGNCHRDIKAFINFKNRFNPLPQILKVKMERPVNDNGGMINREDENITDEMAGRRRKIELLKRRVW